MSEYGCGGGKKVSLRVIVSCDPPSEDVDWEPEEYPEEVSDEKEDTHEKDMLNFLAKDAHELGGCLAGGCLRDYFLGICEAKDYDIFVLGDGSEPAPQLKKYYGKGVFIGKERLKNVRAEVMSITKFYNSDVDLIVINKTTLRDAINTFDSSICKIWTEEVDGEICVFVSGDFIEYALWDVWYLYTEVETTQNHVDRMVKKFGNYVALPQDLSKPILVGRLGELTPENFKDKLREVLVEKYTSNKS